MKPLERILANAARSDRTIALSEGTDPRVIEAAVAAQARGVARPVLVASTSEGPAGRGDLGKARAAGIEIHDPETSPLSEELALLYHSLRRHKGLTLDAARRDVRKSHIYAPLMVRAGHADGCVGGAVLPSAEIIKAAITIIGRAEDAAFVSSFFLMLFCADHHEKRGAHVFGDAGLVVDPSAEQLCDIALSCARSFRNLTGETPKVAMLSFSTKGSASHAAVSRVQQATDLVRQRAPDLAVDGELQFDAAIVPDVGRAKATGSPVAGDANVFIFPNLEAGNIGYKIAQRVGGAVAIGPVIQGLARPANDLSRGCSAEDILHMIAVTAVQASRMTPARQEMAVHP